MRCIYSNICAPVSVAGPGVNSGAIELPLASAIWRARLTAWIATSVLLALSGSAANTGLPKD